MGWSDWQIRAHIGQLEDLEYIRVRLGAMGKEYAYVLNYLGQAEENESGKCFLNLTPVEEIAKLVHKSPILTTPGALKVPGKKIELN
jgi:hypothetical protein